MIRLYSLSQIGKRRLKYNKPQFYLSVCIKIKTLFLQNLKTHQGVRTSRVNIRVLLEVRFLTKLVQEFDVVYSCYIFISLLVTVILSILLLQPISHMLQMWNPTRSFCAIHCLFAGKSVLNVHLKWPLSQTPRR